MMESTKNSKFDFFFQLFCIGSSASGKTSLVSTYVNGIYEEIRYATIGANYDIRIIELENRTIKLAVWDASGSERFRTVNETHYRWVHGFIVVYDITDKDSFDELEIWFSNIDRCRWVAKNASRLLVGCKCDATAKRVVNYESGKKFADDLGIPFLEVSAKDGTNVESAFETIIADIMSRVCPPASPVDSTQNEQIKMCGLKEDIVHMYKNKEFADVTFCVHDGIFPAHKIILAARSPVFAKILMGSSNFEDIIVDEETVTKDGFKILLQFIYTDRMTTTDKKSIVEGYLAARYYGQKSLQVECEKEINAWKISTTNVIELLKSASDIPVLKAKCLDFVRKYPHQVIHVPSFPLVSIETLSTMLRSKSLESAPVAKAFRQVMKWGANHVSPPVSYSVVREMLLNCSPPLLGLLGMEKLNLEQLSDVECDYPGIITPAEVIQFMKYNKRKHSSDLPEWCSNR